MDIMDDILDIMDAMQDGVAKGRRALRPLVKGESGSAPLIIVLVLLVVGAMVLTPIMGLTYSGTKADAMHEKRARQFYSADAGIEDAMWKIKMNRLPTDWLGTWSGASIYSQTYEYQIQGGMNGDGVQVSLQPYWVLMGLEDMDEMDGPHNNMVDITYETTDYTGTDAIFHLYFTLKDSSYASAKKPERIGVYLPTPFQYITGSSNLDKTTYGGTGDFPAVSSWPGGTTLIWTFSNSGSKYSQLPGGSTGKVEITFRYRPGKAIPGGGAFSWTRAQSTDVGVIWSGDVKMFQIISTATDPATGKRTKVQAFTSRYDPTGGATSVLGDYTATGNSLMKDLNNDAKRETLYKESSLAVGTGTVGVPDGATAERILLYWSGWQPQAPVDWGGNKSNQDALWAAAKVNKVNLTVQTATTTCNLSVTAGTYQQKQTPTGTGAAHGWAYSCYADVTQAVRSSALGQDFSGAATYRVGHDSSVISSTGTYQLYDWNTGEALVNQKTSYPLGCPKNLDNDADEWSYAGWSVVVVYSSPQTEGHMLYLYDDFRYSSQSSSSYKWLYYPSQTGWLSFDAPGGTGDAARLTCFVVEGDPQYGNGQQGPYDHDGIDLVNQRNARLHLDEDLDGQPRDADNVWNSIGNGANPSTTALINGVDIDTFTVPWGVSGIQAGDNKARLEMHTGVDVWCVVYTILSFRSNVTSGGLGGYFITN